MESLIPPNNISDPAHIPFTRVLAAESVADDAFSCQNGGLAIQISSERVPSRWSDMSNNAHFLAVDSAALRSNWDPEEILFNDGLTWCGDSFGQSYSMWEQLDTIIAPFLGPGVRAVLAGEAETVVDPAVDVLRTNENGCEITPFSRVEFAELREGVRVAVERADWGPHPSDGWETFAADATDGDFFVLVDFV